MAFEAPAPARPDPFDLPNEVVEPLVHRRAVAHLRERGIALPLFRELTNPSLAPVDADRDAPDPRNLARVHWYNEAAKVNGRTVPAHLVLPPALTGVDARIIVMLGRPFPMINAHKVLAAYACLAPRLAAGVFDPTRQRAVWPSTGNYCRGGVAISTILGCRSVAVLPEGMSAGRFAWLKRWIADPNDIVRTPGSESNVKEIYDTCAALERQPDTMIFNQFCEFPNYLVHRIVTGAAACALFEAYLDAEPDLSLAAFVAATGSAGTIAAGDTLKQRFGTKVAVMEPVECPTLLYNGFGAHNIQGIGDKHVPLIHNVMNADIIVGVSDVATDDLDVVFNHAAGRKYLFERRNVPEALLGTLDALGFSGIGNVLAAIKTARRLKLGPDEVVLTVATDGAELYNTERAERLAGRYRGRFDEVDAAEAFGRHVLGGDSDHLIELSARDRDRVFNLGYFTWVEQQGIALDDFERRRSQIFWDALVPHIAAFDEMITATNHDAGTALARSA